MSSNPTGKQEQGKSGRVLVFKRCNGTLKQCGSKGCRLGAPRRWHGVERASLEVDGRYAGTAVPMCAEAVKRLRKGRKQVAG